MPLLSVDSCASIRPSGSCGSPRADVPHAALRVDDAPEDGTDDGAPAGGAAAADEADELGDGVGEVVGIGGGPELRHDGSVTSAIRARAARTAATVRRRRVRRSRRGISSTEGGMAVLTDWSRKASKWVRSG